MIKNCAFSAVVGTIEDVAALNILNCNLDRYLMDFEDQRCAKSLKPEHKSIGLYPVLKCLAQPLLKCRRNSYSRNQYRVYSGVR